MSDLPLEHFHEKHFKCVPVRIRSQKRSRSLNKPTKSTRIAEQVEHGHERRMMTRTLGPSELDPWTPKKIQKKKLPALPCPF